jgi:ATP-binding cassette subfamily B protein
MKGNRPAPDLRRLLRAQGVTILWNILSGFRLMYGAAVLCIAAAAAAKTVSFFLMRDFIDNVLAARGALNLVVIFVLWFTLFAALEAVATYGRGRLAARSAEGIVLALRNFLFDHIQRLSFRYHDKVRTGDLIERVTSDVETVQRFYGEQATEIGRILALFVINFISLLFIDTTIGLFSIVLLPVVIGLSVWFFKRIFKRYDAYQDQEAALSSTLQENVSAIRIVRAFARHDFEKEKFERDNVEKYRRGRLLVRLHSLYWPITDLLCVAQLLFIFCLGATFVLAGKMSAGTFLAVNGMVANVVWPMRMLGRIVVEASMAVVSGKRLGEVAREEPEAYAFPVIARPATKSGEAPRLRGQVAFDRVCFAYNGGEPVLSDVSFMAEAGAIIAVMGPTGSGKTSLVSLIPRFYHPQSGAVRVGGRDAADYPLEHLRQSIGIVEQEPFLFSRTLRENLVYGAQREVGAEELAAAVKAAALTEVVANLPAGFDTLVGERGVTLSGGQKQRVAIARTILKDPAILILDDATSSVDTETEGEIREALRTLMRGRTCFVIAHRVQTVKFADFILVLKNGRIAEQGTHRELAAGSGFYRTVYELQSRIEGDGQGRGAGAAKGA